MEDMTPPQPKAQAEKQDKAPSGLSAYLAAAREEEAWLHRMQASAKAKKSIEDNPTDS